MMQEEIKNDSVQQKIDNSDNSKALLDLIQSIQSKMNTSDPSNTYEKSNTIPNIEANQVKEEKEDQSKQQQSNNNFDLSSLASLLSKMDLSSILSSFGNTKTENNPLGNLDPSTIYKFQRVLTSMNKENPQKNLLLSLKPFLRKSRQDKLGEYMTILTVADAIGIFSSKGSD